MSQEDHAADFSELERQLEQGSLFTHTALTDQIVRVNEDEAFIYGLIDLLLRKGLIQTDELQATAKAVKTELIDKKEFASLGVAMRVDNSQNPLQPVAVNCAERMPVCQGVCCRLRFALSAEEIEAGWLKWELGKPYYNRHNESGTCHRLDPLSRGCQIYEHRPSICRQYSCAKDQRIWLDFDKMLLNTQWIEENTRDSANLHMGIVAMQEIGNEPGSARP